MTIRLEKGIAYVILVLFSFVAIWPLASIILLSLNAPGSLVAGLQLPKPLTLASYVRAWTGGGFGRALLSSAIVASCVVGAADFFSILMAYAFGRMKFPGSSVLFYYLLLGVIVPYDATIIPIYYQFKNLHLLNTYWALILPQTAFSISFGVFWLRGFFRSFPEEIVDAGRVDGVGSWGMLWRVIAPNAGPAMLALSAILFIWTWNDLLIAIVMAQNPSMRLAPAALAFFAGGQRTVDLSVVGAASILVALPVVVIYVLLQRYYIEGIVAGSVVK